MEGNLVVEVENIEADEGKENPEEEKLETKNQELNWRIWFQKLYKIWRNWKKKMPFPFEKQQMRKRED